MYYRITLICTLTDNLFRATITRITHIMYYTHYVVSCVFQFNQITVRKEDNEMERYKGRRVEKRWKGRKREIRKGSEKKQVERIEDAGIDLASQADLLSTGANQHSPKVK